MACCDVTKDQNAAVVFQEKQQTCTCAMFELLEFHVLPLRVPLVISLLLCSRVPCRWVSGMEEVYDKKTKSNHWVRTTKEKGRKIEGTGAQVYFGYLPARSV